MDNDDDACGPVSGRIHKCNACGKEDIWGPTWSYYGSYRQVEEELPVYKACSDECMSRRVEVEERDQEALKLKRRELVKQLKSAERTAKLLRQQIADLA